VAEIFGAMRQRFPSYDRCFINENFAKLQRHSRGAGLLETGDALNVLDDVEFGPLARFFRLQYR
jgi:hypothetical protein